MLCNAGVDFLISRDRAGRIRFAAKQSPAGAAALRARGLDPTDLSTLLVIDGARVLRRLDAALVLARYLGPGWRLLAAPGWLLPSGLRDRLYDAVATRRYRWFGKRADCRLPSEAEAARFL